MFKYFVVFFVVLIWNDTADSGDLDSQSSHKKDSDIGPVIVIPVSLVQLIVQPAKYEGYYVSVGGYLSVMHSPRLFLTKAHALGNDYMSSIALRDTTDYGFENVPCFEGWRQVQGKIELRSDGFTYRLVSVVSIRKANRKLCWEPSYKHELKADALNLP